MARRRRAWTPETLGLPDEEVIRGAVGRQLKRLRTASDLTIEWMARHLDIDVAVYESYENGSDGIPIERAFRAAQLVGVPIEELMKDAPLLPEERQLRSHIAVARKIHSLPDDTRKLLIRLLETMLCDD